MNTDRSLARSGLGLLVALAVAATAFAQTPPVVIVTQPVNRSVTVGTSATFSVTATGIPTLTYQWRKNGVNIVGATAATYSTPATLSADNGSVYSVVVTNPSGPFTSTNATLTVNAQAAIAINGPGGVAAGQTATFTISATGGTAPFTYQWLRNGALIPGATSATYVTPPTNVVDDDKSVFQVRVTDASGIVTTSAGESLVVFKATQTITFTAPSNPVVSPSPVTLAATASSGLTVALSVVAGPASVSGNSLTLTAVGSVTVRASQAGNLNYNPATVVERTFTVNKGTPVITWANPSPVVDGIILGATQLNATANVPGTFAYSPASGTTLRVPSQTLTGTFTPTDTTNYNGASAQRTLAVGAADSARLTNVSVRATLAASQTLIVGFTMQGGGKSVLLRAVGPGLTQLSVTGAMPDPRIALFKDTTLLETNDNWGGGPSLSGAFVSVGAFGLPATSLDAAIVRSIEGGHTAQITGPPGIVLVEAYDAGMGVSPRFTNVSARNRAGTGGDILIAGFTVDGTGQRNLLIRAVGPTLANLGVSGTLADPKLEVYSGSTKIAENDTWSAILASAFSSVGAFNLTPGSKDAALTIMLPAGSYTVQVSGADGGTGEAVVEVYELP